MRKRVIVLACGTAVLGLAAPAKKHSTEKDVMVAGAPRTEARKIQYAKGNAERIYVQHGWQTIVELPANESYVDFLLGDTPPSTKAGNASPQHWIVNSFKGAKYVSIRPYKNTLAETDLTITAESGRNITLILEDVSKQPGAHADTTVILKTGQEVEEDGPDGRQKFAKVADLDEIKKSIGSLGEKIDAEDARLVQGLADNKQAALLADAATPRGEYKYNRHKAAAQPFGVKKMWNNGKYTFISVNTTEVPALYEFKDNKPNYTNWDFEKGVYFVPHVVDKGELRIGKKKLVFTKEEGKL